MKFFFLSNCLQLWNEGKSLLVRTRSDVMHFESLEAPRVSFTNVKGCKTFLVLKLIRVPKKLFCCWIFLSFTPADGDNMNGSSVARSQHIISYLKIWRGFLTIKKKFSWVLAFECIWLMETFILYHYGMKSQTYSALFWVLTKKTALFYVVAMAVLSQNQQNTNLREGCFYITSEWKILLICEILLQDQYLIDGKSKFLLHS